MRMLWVSPPSMDISIDKTNWRCKIRQQICLKLTFLFHRKSKKIANVQCESRNEFSLINCVGQWDHPEGEAQTSADKHHRYYLPPGDSRSEWNSEWWIDKDEEKKNKIYMKEKKKVLVGFLFAWTFQRCCIIQLNLLTPKVGCKNIVPTPWHPLIMSCWFFGHAARDASVVLCWLKALVDVTTEIFLSDTTDLNFSELLMKIWNVSREVSSCKNWVRRDLINL